MLRVGFEISTDCEAVERELQVLVQSAKQPEPPRRTVRYQVTRRDGSYEIRRDGEVVNVEFEAGRVLVWLYRRVQDDALSAWPAATVLHGVSGSCRGERFLMVGESVWDRSHTAQHLMGLGVAVEGDDLAILSEGVVTAYPRPLHVWDSAPLPAHAPSTDTLPFVGAPPAEGFWVLDLARANVEWQIVPGVPQLLVELQTNYGGHSRASELTGPEMARALVSSCQPLGSPAQAIQAVTQLVDRARRVRLRLGAFDDIAGLWPGRLP